MTVRAELEELAKWISELQEKEKPAEPHHLTRGTWRSIADDLEWAADRFGAAHDVLAKQQGGTFLAELARDLQGQAEERALRARVIARRMPKGAAPTASGDDDGLYPPTKRKRRRAAPHLRAAQRALASAHEKLNEADNPDELARRFEEEIDDLAEMTLGLRHRYRRLEAGERAQ